MRSHVGGTHQRSRDNGDRVSEDHRHGDRSGDGENLAGALALVAGKELRHLHEEYRRNDVGHAVYEVLGAGCDCHSFKEHSDTAQSIVNRSAGHSEAETGLELLLVEYHERGYQHYCSEHEVHHHHERRRRNVAALRDNRLAVALVESSHSGEEQSEAYYSGLIIGDALHRGLVVRGAVPAVEECCGRGSGEGEDNRAPEARVHEEAVVVFQEAGGHIGSDAYLSHSGCKCKYPPGNDHPQSQSAVVFHI